MFNLQRIKKHEKLYLVFLTLASAFLRLTQLGYSHFYGDETKVLFLRKDQALWDFLLNQRKGPIQFLVAWFMENITGGFSEFWMRLPFALAGVASVLAFYFIVRKMFNFRVAALAAPLFSVNGFYIAFSRTVQYQSFLVFFGLISLLALLYAFENKRYQNLLFVVAAVSLALSYLSHYDAVFYDIAAAGILVWKFMESTQKNRFLKSLVLYILVPFLLVVGAFYIPYIQQGYFSDLTVNYLERRADGQEYLKNKSIFTMQIYNTWVFFVAAALAFFAFIKEFDARRIVVFVWFLPAFILFEFIFLNPGTHIHNYFPPLFILIALGVEYLREKFGPKLTKPLVHVLPAVLFAISAMIYVPFLSQGYPWRNSDLLVRKLEKNRVEKRFHLFLYGFPYNRGWDQVAEYFDANTTPRSFYTNDNLTIGEFYLHGVAPHSFGNLQYPEYYIDVLENQEFNITPVEVLHDYDLVQKIYVDGKHASTIYKVKDSVRQFVEAEKARAH